MAGRQSLSVGSERQATGAAIFAHEAAKALRGRKAGQLLSARQIEDRYRIQPSRREISPRARKRDAAGRADVQAANGETADRVEEIQARWLDLDQVRHAERHDLSGD